MNAITTWLIAIAVTMAMGAAAAYYDTEATADTQDAAALASRAFAAQAVCGQHSTAHWLDDKTLQCLPHGPDDIDPNAVQLAAK